MDKVIFLLFERAPMPRPARREALLERAAPDLLAAGVRRLGMDIADDRAAVPSPTPFPLGATRPVALVNAWVDDLATVSQLLPVFAREEFTAHAWHVEESVYTDYGDNAHAGRRDWADGTRSPGIVTVNLLERPRRMDKGAWIAHWHDVMSPVSERIQPRTRYVRNLVLTALTPDAPPYEGIVEECWPTPQTLADPWTFYGAKGPVQLVGNLLAILRAVTGFLTIWRVMTVPMSEYFVQTSEVPRTP